MEELDDIARLLEELGADPDVRHRARAQILEMGAGMVVPLMETLLSENGRQAQAAAEILGEIADPRALDALFAALASPSPLLGWEALKSILKYPADMTLIRLAETLSDYQIMTQQNIILAIKDCNDQSVVPALIRQLNQAKSPTLRYAIIQTLAVLGDAQAIPAIRAHENDPDHHVREWAAVALRQLSSAH